MADPNDPSFRWLIDNYLDWCKGEGVPVVDAFAVDLTTVETAPWPRLGKGVKGAIVNLKGRGDFVALQVIDLPPGTGDVQLTMLSKHKPAGAVIVSTPQDLALMDATRAIGLFEQGKVPLIGMVENMAGYVCPHCGEESDPFGVGGAEAAAKTMGLPFLGRVPLDMTIRRESDAGNPPAAGDGPQAEAFLSIARGVLA